MGKDNSTSRSELQFQLEQTNELLKNTEKSIQEALRKVEEEEKKTKVKTRILKSFSKELICVYQPNDLKCQHSFCECVESYLTQDEITECNKAIREGNEDKIIEKLTKKIRKHFNSILEELNQITELEFYMENSGKLNLRVVLTKLVIRRVEFEFTVSIR